MQQGVSKRRPLLVSGRYVLVNIILDMSLAYGLTTRPRANTIIDTVTYLVDGTYLSTVVLGGVLSPRGRARRRAVVLSARKYILHIHTRPTVAWDPPPGAYRARSGSRTILLTSDVNSAGQEKEALTLNVQIR